MALDRCKGCGLCVPVCMPGVLEMTELRNAKGYMLPRLLDGCTGCRACADICPDYVFEVYRFDHVDDPSRTRRRRGGLTMPLVLREGYDAIAEAAVDVGCRFFAGYPMLPFTGLLDAFTRAFEPVGGVMIQADTEIEGVNMALGAAATGARAATGSTGQGVALMQEAIAEAALNELPLVIFTMARGQQDYFQCTRGGGWGDYRTITLAPSSVVEADEHTRLAFELADKWLTPVILYGDHMIGFTQMTVEHDPERAPTPMPDKPWALDGSSGGTGRSKVIWTWRKGKHNTPGLGPDQHWRNVADKYDEVALVEARHVATHVDDAAHLVVSFGTTGPFVDYVVDELRAEGHAIGTFRPVTLWPFPADALADAAAGCEQVLVYELNAGQMVDDVRLAVNGAVPVHSHRRREPGRVGHAPGRACSTSTPSARGFSRQPKEQCDDPGNPSRPRAVPGRSRPSRPTSCRPPTTTSARAAGTRSRGASWWRCSTS